MTTDTHRAMIKAIGPLFIPGAFPRQEQEGTERQLLDVYLIAVEEIAPGFIAMAAKRFIQGQVVGASVTFRPTPAELAVEARRLRDKALDSERLAVARLPKPEADDPPESTLEERDRCAEMWGKAKAEIADALVASKPPRQTRYRTYAPEPAKAEPAVDVSDFPPANASHAELKAWEERQKAGEHADH